MKADYVLLIIFRTKGTPRYTQVSGTPCSRYTHTHTCTQTRTHSLIPNPPFSRKCPTRISDPPRS